MTLVLKEWPGGREIQLRFGDELMTFNDIIQRSFVVEIGQSAIVQMLQGFSGLYFYGLPNDCFISQIWLREETRSICLMLHHPSFEPVAIGATRPRLNPKFRYRFRLNPSEVELIMYHDPTVVDNEQRSINVVSGYGFAPTEEGDSAETLHTLKYGTKEGN